MELESAGLPPRYRWMQRAGLACAAVLLAVVGLRLLWGQRSKAVLRAEIERIVAAGEPLYPQDFNAPPSFRGPGSTAQLILAHDAISLTQTQEGRIQQLPRLSKMTDEDFALIAEAFERTVHSRDVVREARLAGVLDWPVDIRGRGQPNRGILEQCSTRELRIVRLLCSAALHHHRQSNDGQAAESLVDALWVSEHMGQLPYLYSHLWALYGSRWVVYYVEEMSPRLWASAADQQGAPPDEDAALAAHGLIERLLDERTTNEQLVRAVQSERMLVFGDVEQLFEGRFKGFGYGSFAAVAPVLADLIERPLFEPAYRFDAARLLRHMSTVGESLAAPDWPSVQDLLPARLRPPRGLARLIYPLSRRSDMRYGWYAQMHFRTTALRRMAAAALALRQYEVRQASRPDDLAALVPRYLPAVPQDPFGPQSQSLSYTPQSQPPLLYSIGPDGRDDGGKLPPDFRDPRHWQKNDLPYFLDGDRNW